MTKALFCAVGTTPRIEELKISVTGGARKGAKYLTIHAGQWLVKEFGVSKGVVKFPRQ